jgi:hypothetical protein
MSARSQTTHERQQRTEDDVARKRMQMQGKVGAAQAGSRRGYVIALRLMPSVVPPPHIIAGPAYAEVSSVVRRMSPDAARLLAVAHRTGTRLASLVRKWNARAERRGQPGLAWCSLCLWLYAAQRFAGIYCRPVDLRFTAMRGRQESRMVRDTLEPLLLVNDLETDRGRRALRAMFTRGWPNAAHHSRKEGPVTTLLTGPR